MYGKCSDSIYRGLKYVLMVLSKHFLLTLIALITAMYAVAVLISPSASDLSYATIFLTEVVLNKTKTIHFLDPDFVNLSSVLITYENTIHKGCFIPPDLSVS